MEGLKCDICGGTDLVKQNGVFVCQSCGCKYSIDDVKKMMIELTGSIKVAGVNTLEEEIQNAETLISVGDFDKAYEIYTELSAKYSYDYRTWLGKIRCKKHGCFFARIGANSIQKAPLNDWVKEDSDFKKALLVAKDSEKIKIDEEYSNFLQRILENNNISTNELRAIIQEPHKLDGYGGYSKDPEYYKEDTSDYTFLFKYYNDNLYLIMDMCPFDCIFWAVSIKENGKIACDKSLIFDFEIRTINNKRELFDVLIKSTNNSSNLLFEIIEINNDGITMQIPYGNRCVTLIRNYDCCYDSYSRSWLASLNNDQMDKIIHHLNSNGKCYIATAVYGSYNCPEVWVLRRFRDNILALTWYGRAFIKVYYAISPTLVKWFGKTKWFNRFWKDRLDKLVYCLHVQGISDTPYQD